MRLAMREVLEVQLDCPACLGEAARTYDHDRDGALFTNAVKLNFFLTGSAPYADDRSDPAPANRFANAEGRVRAS